MKKFIALFLVLVMAFSCILVSCKKDEQPDEPDTSDDEFIGIGTPAPDTSTSPTSTTAPQGNTASEFTWTDDTAGTMVYVKIDALNVRSDTNTSEDTYKATAYFGESYKRLKYNEQWTLIDYKGNQYYVSTKYVTTDAGSIIFTDDAAPSTVYVNVENALYLRTSTYYADNYDKNIAVVVKRGATLTRIGTSKNGAWIKVKYADDNRVLYCNTDYTSPTPPSDETVAQTTPITPEG